MYGKKYNSRYELGFLRHKNTYANTNFSGTKSALLYLVVSKVYYKQRWFYNTKVSICLPILVSKINQAMYLKGNYEQLSARNAYGPYMPHYA